MHVLIVGNGPVIGGYAHWRSPFLHTVNRPVLPAARFTPTGYFCIVGDVYTARFLSVGLGGSPAYVESSSTTKKSLNGLHVHSGYSELMKLSEKLKLLAL